MSKIIDKIEEEIADKINEVRGNFRRIIKKVQLQAVREFSDGIKLHPVNGNMYPDCKAIEDYNQRAEGYNLAVKELESLINKKLKELE